MSSYEPLKKSFSITASVDPSALAALIQFYESHGIRLHSSYGELVNAMIDDILITHDLSIVLDQDRAIASLNAYGFSTKQLESSRGARKAARRSRLEELASESEHAETRLSSRIPEHLQAKFYGEDDTPWTDAEIEEMRSLGLVDETGEE